MAYYRTCEFCGANLDPGENCDCAEAQYFRLTPAGKRKVIRKIEELLRAESKKPEKGLCAMI